MSRANLLHPIAPAGEAAMVLVHVYVEVTEAALGIDFYCHGLGLTLKRRLSPTWIELAGANCPLYLLANRPAIADLGSTEVCRSYERYAGSLGFCCV